MTRKPWMSIAILLGAALAGVPGLSGLDSKALETWAGVVMLLTWGVLMLSSTCAISRGPRASPWSVGFAAFGWGYLALAYWYSYWQGPLPTTWLVPGSNNIHGDLRSAAPLVRITNEAWALVLAVMGGTLADRLSRKSSAGEPGCADEPFPGGAERGWWRKPTGFGLVGLVLVLATTLVSWLWDAGLGAGAAFMLTWGFAGLSTIGAMCARGRPREVWLGAASFGGGYMILAFGPVSPAVLPTNHLLNAIARPSGPMTAGPPEDERSMDEEKRRVEKALDEPITLHFAGGTSLRVLLDRIQPAIRWSLGRELVVGAGADNPFLVRPADLDQVIVSIDRENIPVKEALRLCLAQLGLTYRVRSGGVLIVPDTYQPIPFEDDPVMIAGHSLLALFAAAIGGVASPIIASRCGRPGAN